MEQGLFERLNEYAEKDIYPFHMPGHKRNTKLFPYPNPYGLDITEIEGFDNLHSPKGILRDAMARCARLYGAEESCFLVNGSTGGLLSAISGMTRAGDRVLTARNCHRAVCHGILLNNLNPVYLWPDTGELGISGGIDPAEVERALADWPDIRLVVVTSPTYEGIVSDIEAIAGIAHGQGIPLLVDEAHGAHFGFHRGFPDTALSCGADVVIQSVHKTLPAFTQSALLHMQGGLADREKIKSYLSIYQSSSPSYLLMAGIDRCMGLIENEGKGLFEGWNDMLEEFYEKSGGLSHVTVRRIQGERPDKRVHGINLTNVYDIDKSKIVLKAGFSHSGVWLSDQLLRRFGLQVEMASRHYALAMTGAGERKEGLERLLKALKSLDGEEGEAPVGKQTAYPRLPQGAEMVLAPFAAYACPAVQIPLEECEGRIAGDYVYPYPPGIPLLIPGERIARDAAGFIKACLSEGIAVEGLKEKNKITVLAEGKGEKGCRYFMR